MIAESNGSKQHCQHYTQAISLTENEIEACSNHGYQRYGRGLSVVSCLYDNEKIRGESCCQCPYDAQPLIDVERTHQHIETNEKGARPWNTERLEKQD